MKIEVMSLNENLEGMKLEVGGEVTIVLSPSRLFHSSSYRRILQTFPNFSADVVCLFASFFFKYK